MVHGPYKYLMCTFKQAGFIYPGFGFCLLVIVEAELSSVVLADLVLCQAVPLKPYKAIDIRSL